MNKPVQNGSSITRDSVAEAIIDSSAVMFLLLDRDGRIARFNHTCEKVSGYRADEVIGKFPWDTLLPPEQADSIKQEAFDVLDNPKNLQSRYINYWQLKNGERRLIEWNNTALLDETGEIEFIVSVGNDITDRDRAEQELHSYREDLEVLVAERSAEIERVNRRNQLIVHAAMDGFFVADKEGKIRDCNEAYCQMLGYSRDELLALRIPDIEAIEDKEEVAAHIDKVTRLGSDRFDTLHRHKDGRVIDVEVSVTLTTLDNEPLFYAFVHDITRRKRGEEELIRARLEAERANEAKSDFLSRMSHELRTPLNAILGFGQLLVTEPEEKLTDSQSANVNEILQAGYHLLEMVNEILDLSRIESGKISTELKNIDLCPIIRNCITQLYPLAMDRGINITSETQRPCIANADPVRVKQILINLLSNAIKYNFDGGKVHITCKNSENGNIRISVQDTGPGIPAESLPHLFSPFERLASSYNSVEGTGIGLALVKNLVELMHGQTGVDSEPGEGSTFWFEIPAATSQHSDKPASQEEEHNFEYTNNEIKKHVLYVEDNRSNLKLMQKIIAARSNLELISAKTAAEGLTCATEQRPDLIFLDINLPDMNGFDILQKLKTIEETRNIPVIAVSANAQPRDIERARAAGFVDYITKPFEIDELMASLDECIGSNKNSSN